MRGTVLFFKDTYGFIRADGYDNDIFFHYKTINNPEDRREISSGDYVEFEFEDNSDDRAINVRVVDEIVKGKKLIKVHVYKIIDGEFELKDFYEKVVSKIPIGLKHVTIIGESMIATSEKVSFDVIIKITKAHHKKGIYVDITDEYTIKFI